MRAGTTPNGQPRSTALYEANLQSVNEKLEGMEEYQAEVQEESYISGLHR